MAELKLIIQPDQDDDEAAEVLVDGRLGDRPYRFLLDTGAARTSVQLDDYTSTFSSEATNSSSGVFAPIQDDVITVPSLEIGPISKQNFTLVRSNDPQRNMPGLIGMDILKDFCCHFLFAEQRVLLDAEHECGIGSSFQPLFLDQKFHPYVEVQFGAVTANSVWDTGAGITIADLGFVQKHPALFEQVGHSTGTDAGGTQVQTPMFIMAASLIGGSSFPPHKVAGVDLSRVNATLDVPMDLILGYSTLSKANWVFDFPRKQWAVSKRLGVQ